MADPDFELRREGGGGFYFTCPAGFSSFSHFFFFFTQNNGKRPPLPPPLAPPLDPTLDSCFAQMCILLALTKAIDLQIHLSLTCEPTISQQKHFSTRISLPATHQGVKVSSKAKHLGCFKLTPQKQVFMKILDNSNHAYTREVIQILW